LIKFIAKSQVPIKPDRGCFGTAGRDNWVVKH